VTVTGQLAPALGSFRLPARMSRPARREHLLDVAATTVVTLGLDAVTMERIAAQAGVSKGLGYAYFANRDELLVALFDRELDALDLRVEAAMTAVPTFEAKLRVSLETWFEAAAERGLLMAALLQAKLTDGPLEERRRERHARIVQMYGAMVTDEYGFDQRQAATAVALLLGAYGGALELWTRRRVARREIIDTYVVMALGALGALAAPEGLVIR
jgi:AcrR family transcriptional regulator